MRKFVFGLVVLALAAVFAFGISALSKAVGVIEVAVVPFSSKYSVGKAVFLAPLLIYALRFSL